MSQAPCIEYKSSFVKSDLELIKLNQNYDDGQSRSYKTPVFNGEGAVECFFYVEERFRHYAAKLEWTTGPEMFDNFEEVLQDTALEKWETRIGNIAPVDRTMGRFDQAIGEYLLEYVDPLAKDYMIKYLKDFRRPMHTKPRDHATRIETLIRYTNRLPGTEPNITLQQTKNMIFESFPVAWRQSWIRAGKSLVTNTLAELVQFMANEQSFADDKDKIKKKDGSGNKTKESYRNGNHQGGRSGRGGGRKRRDREGGRGGRGGNHRDNKYSKNGPSPDDDCPIHGGHLWRKCNQNPRGDNYNPARGGGRDNGQGRGNTNPGRGNYGRGGGRGGRNNNNNNSGNNQNNEHHHMDGAPQQGTANNSQGANQQHNAEHHHLDMIGNPPPAGQGVMPGWRG
jgi:hypothetical protein